VNVSVGSPDFTTIANLCDPAADGWSGSWSPTGSAFAIVQGGTLMIYHPDGHENRILDGMPGIDGVSWSPDGSWLSVTGGAHSYVLRPDGSGMREIPGMPSWSPDGRTMAISRPDGVLLVGSSEGPGLVALGSIPAPATWSPDGSRFGFMRDGNLWTVAIDGTDARNVTALPLGGASWATWSPDGRVDCRVRKSRGLAGFTDRWRQGVAGFRPDSWRLRRFVVARLEATRDRNLFARLRIRDRP